MRDRPVPDPVECRHCGLALTACRKCRRNQVGELLECYTCNSTGWLCLNKSPRRPHGHRASWA
jgi:hypothetical protein